MRLSEAIRLGATMKPQCFGAEKSDDGGSCARGAAADAFGVADWFSIPREVLRFACDTTVGCPNCDRDPSTLGSIIAYHLNDYHKWTREQIADWVELHEPLPVPEQPETPTELQESVIL